MKTDQPFTRVVTITGLWKLNDEELEELIDHALHEAGLCGCKGPGAGYVMTVERLGAEVPKNSAQ